MLRPVSLLFMCWTFILNAETSGESHHLLRAKDVIDRFTQSQGGACPAPENFSAHDKIEITAQYSENEAKDYQHFKLVVSDPKDVPKALRDMIPGEVFERAKGEDIEISLSLPNDNPGYGLWSLMTGNNVGNDEGHTHSFITEAGREIKSLYWRIEAESNFYTKAIRRTANIDGTTAQQQYFTEENAVRLIVDNMNQGKAFFWEAGIGWRELNNDKTRKYLSGWQQGKYHDFLAGKEADWAPIVNNIPDPARGSEKGFEAQLGMGFVRDTIMNNGTARLNWVTTVSGHVGELDSSNYGQLKSKGQLFIQKKPDGVSYKMGTEVETKQGNDVNETTARFELGVGRGNASATLYAEKPVLGSKGRADVVEFDDDTIWGLELRCKFSRGNGCFKGLFGGRLKR